MKDKEITVTADELQKQKLYTADVAAIMQVRAMHGTPKALVRTYGCQQNVADGERIKGMLSEMGFEFTEDEDEADFILFNTCAIREHAKDRYAEMALNYARLNSTSNDLVFAKVEVEPVIKRVVRQYAGQFVRKHIALKCDIAPVQVLTDEKWLAFILGQLLANAVKYTESGTVTVTVTKDKVLKVSDTGIGIAPEDLPRIFEKGFTGYNGRAEKKSTGLGMYLSRRAADMLGHTLSVQSAPGAGSTFSLDMKESNLQVE